MGCCSPCSSCRYQFASILQLMFHKKCYYRETMWRWDVVMFSTEFDLTDAAAVSIALTSVKLWLRSDHNATRFVSHTWSDRSDCIPFARHSVHSHAFVHHHHDGDDAKTLMSLFQNTQNNAIRISMQWHEAQADTHWFSPLEPACV